MKEIDFDGWEDYKPVNELDLIEKENKNLLKLLKDDKINLLNISKQDFDQMFDNSCEEDYNGNIFMRFLKVEDYQYDDKTISLFEDPKNEEFFIFKKDEEIYFLYVYQFNSYYKDKSKVTFVGWDYNVIFNLKKMKCKEIETR